MFKYACLNNISDKGLENFTSQYEKTDDLAAAQGILVRSAAMHDMAFSPDLLAIARAGAGVNNIPVDRCAKEGIVVFNTPGANANGVKEMVLAGMLLASRDIAEGVNWVRSNKDMKDIAKLAEKEKKKFAGTELAGKRLGIIGLGAIGVRVANMAVELGMEVFGYDPYVSVDAAWHLNRKITHVFDLNEIYDRCDFITIHVPALPSTEGMIDREAVKKMKKGVILINMARDLLVDEEAVVQAIGAGKIRRYVSDFPNPVVAGKKGCITTPHLGASTEEAEDNCAVMAVEEIVDFIENGNITNSVNFPAMTLGPRRSIGQRIAIIHRNEPGVINALTEAIASHGHNLANILSKARGDYAYTLIDIDDQVGDDAVDKMQAREAVIRARIL